MEYYERNIKTTIKITSSNKKEVEKLILELSKVGGIDELTAGLILQSTALI